MKLLFNHHPSYKHHSHCGYPNIIPWNLINLLVNIPTCHPPFISSLFSKHHSIKLLDGWETLSSSKWFPIFQREYWLGIWISLFFFMKPPTKKGPLASPLRLHGNFDGISHQVRSLNDPLCLVQKKNFQKKNLQKPWPFLDTLHIKWNPQLLNIDNPKKIRLEDEFLECSKIDLETVEPMVILHGISSGFS